VFRLGFDLGRWPGLHRELRYRGPIYGDQPDSLCLPSSMTPSMCPTTCHVTSEIIHRTPGFFGRQQQSWLYHCGDGAAFLGPAGYVDLEPYADAIDMLRESHRQYGWSLQPNPGWPTDSPRRRTDRVPVSMLALQCSPRILGHQLIEIHPSDTPRACRRHGIPLVAAECRFGRAPWGRPFGTSKSWGQAPSSLP
jgi:hypothetical protein